MCNMRSTNCSEVFTGKSLSKNHILHEMSDAEKVLDVQIVKKFIDIIQTYT